MTAVRRTLEVLDDDLDALTDHAGGAAGTLTAAHRVPSGTGAGGPQPAAECALADLALRRDALVCGLATDPGTDPLQDPVCRRLDALGFVPGEVVRVSARGPFGGDPLVVDVGSTRFALRRTEARLVRVVPVAGDRPEGS